MAAGGPAPEPPGPRAPLWLRLVLPLAIAGLTFAAFTPALSHDFVNWDDDKVVYENDGFRGLGLRQLGWDFTNYTMGHYHPLTWISFGIDYSLWGIKDAFGYHLTNILLHALSAVLFYFLAARLLSIARGITGPPSLAARSVAAVAALFFAMHPLRVESVAWVTERRDVLSVFFLIPCVLCYVRYALGGPGRWRWYAASVALLLVSLLSKAWGMTLPIVLLVLDVYPLRRIRPAPQEPSAPAARRVLADKIPFVLLAGLAACLAANAQATSRYTMMSLAEYGVAQRFAQACYGLVFYIWKTILPTGLGPLYEIPPQMSPFEPRFVLCAALVVAGVVAVLKLRSYRPAAAAALVVYVLILLPVLGFAQSGPQLVADRYSYVACLPLALLAGGGLWRGAQHLSQRWPRASAVALGSGAALTVIALLGVLTWRQAHIWRDSQTLWRRVLAYSPNSYCAHYNLGVDFVNHKRPEPAITELNEALRLAPGEPEALISLGRALYLQGRTTEAIEHYTAALKLRPDSAVAHSQVGDLLARAGQTAAAIKHYRAALQVAPDKWGAANNLALLLATSLDPTIRDPTEAVRLAEQACRATRFSEPVFLNTLAAAYAEAGRFDDAVQTLEKLAPLAAAEPNRALLEDVQRRIKLYRQHRTSGP